LAGDELQEDTENKNSAIIESQRIWINKTLYDFYQIIAKVTEVRKI
jgi:hypothetical protein